MEDSKQPNLMVIVASAKVASACRRLVRGFRAGIIGSFDITVVDLGRD